MAQLQQKVGCTDKNALNYDTTATIPCNGCCIYPTPKNIIGCVDKMANNYNSSATVACEDCCTYNEIITKDPIISKIPFGTPLIPLDTTYPYSINPEGANCILDTIFNITWIVSDPKTQQSYYGNSFLDYKKELEKVVYGSNPLTVPNWDSSATMEKIWSAFDILLINKPNHRVFINNVLYTPWIIPLYINELGDVNPNRERFITDCDTVGGEMYIYHQQSYDDTTKLIEELDKTKNTQTKTQEEYDEYNTYLKSTNNEPTQQELTKLDTLKKEVNDQNKLVTELEQNIKATSTNTKPTPTKDGSFMACLCNNSAIVEPIKCETISTDGVVYSITPTRAKCVKNYEDYIKFLTQNSIFSTTYSGDFDYISTTYFNTFVLTQLGISQDDAEFIMINHDNYTPAYYPLNSSTLDTINGSTRSKEIIKKAFIDGANIWLPLSADLSTDIIRNKECCDLVGGIYKEGQYQPNPPAKNLKTGGVCLCNEIKEPCPTLTDGSITTITETITDRGGSVITTTYVNVTEECCSNASLESKMSGNWTWDGVRCVLIDEEDTNVCNESTIITVSETPINIKGIECVDDTVTITAYIYFEEPNNRCTNGLLVGDETLLTDDVVNLYLDQPTNAEEIATYSQEKDWTTESNFISENDLDPNTTQTTNCCYDTNVPIEGLLIIQNENHVKIDGPFITYVDTFSSTQTTINTNANVGTGFNRWVKLTTVVDISNLPTTQPFYVGVEFIQGLFKCCNYDIYFDDIQVGCLQAGVREIYNVEQCVGFKLNHVIDNKKSWVYNPGTNTMSDSVEDNIIRGNGTLGMNITQSNPFIIDGGHGNINRVFAPSVDAELPFRDTDYFGFHGVIEKHSKLVLNSKEVMLTFNMCPDGDCTINPTFLIDDDGNYVLDDDGGRIIVGFVPFPNLIQLETFKKTFQGFWVEFMEQFIPATTIFVSGEKWCNSRICSEIVVNDYLLDIENNSGVISPTPTTETVPEPTNPNEPNTTQQSTPVTGIFGEKGSTPTEGEKGTTNDDELGPVIVGNTKIYSLESLDPEAASNVTYNKLQTLNTQ